MNSSLLRSSILRSHGISQFTARIVLRSPSTATITSSHFSSTNRPSNPSNTSHPSTKSATIKDRSYAYALHLLDSIASNRAVVKMIGQSSKDMNARAIPEMQDWLLKAGMTPLDLQRLSVVHVTGTKGKGSVCAMVASILQQYKDRVGDVGLYTSPHLVTPRERIRINGEPVSQETFARSFFRLWDRFEDGSERGHGEGASPVVKPGYFRYLTLMSWDIFLEAGVRSAVYECGIGGEYDSTNILPAEAVTVAAVTMLGIDHTEMLGETVKEIAWHKSGIFKAGVTALSAPQIKDAEAVLKERASEKGCTLRFLDLEMKKKKDIRTSLRGDFQKMNAWLAAEAAGAHMARLGFNDCSETEEGWPAAFDRGLMAVKWPGRCEVREEGNVKWFIDGAHNGDSLDVAGKWYADVVNAARLEEEGKAEINVIVFNQQIRDGVPLLKRLYTTYSSALKNRDSGRFTHAVFCDNTVFSSNSKPDQNTLKAQQEMARAWKMLEPHGEEPVVLASVEEAVGFVREMARDGNARVLVTGSLHLVGGVIRVLEAKEEGDEAVRL